jgi:hypothetical protein
MARIWSSDTRRRTPRTWNGRELPIAGMPSSETSDPGGALGSAGRRPLLPGCPAGGELFLMDLALGRSVPSVDAALGAGLPISSKKSILDALRHIHSEHDQPLEGPDGVALSIASA